MQVKDSKFSVILDLFDENILVSLFCHFMYYINYECGIHVARLWAVFLIW